MDEPRTILYSGELQPGTSTFQAAYVTAAEGDLVFEAQDVGDVPREVFCDNDYEWWVRVASTDKPRVPAGLRADHPHLDVDDEGDTALLGALQAVFGGRVDAADAARR